MENIGLIEKIRRLGPAEAREIEEHVDLLESASQTTLSQNNSLQSRGITRESAAEQRAALANFEEDWNLPEMDVYDEI